MDSSMLCTYEVGFEYRLLQAPGGANRKPWAMNDDFVT